LRIKLLGCPLWHKNLRSNNTFRCEYTFYCDLTIAKILSCNVWTVNAHICQVIVLSWAFLQVVGLICTHLSSYCTKLSILQVVGPICTHLPSCCMMGAIYSYYNGKSKSITRRGGDSYILCASRHLQLLAMLLPPSHRFCLLSNHRFEEGKKEACEFS